VQYLNALFNKHTQNPYSGADFHIISLQPERSTIYCKTINTRLVHHVVSLFMSQLVTYWKSFSSIQVQTGLSI